MSRAISQRIALRHWDRALPVLLALVLFALALSRILDYGLTWDEPTYLRFAQLQRDWIFDFGAALFGRGDLGSVLAAERIQQAWLQHPAQNGHPPLNETWMGLASLPFRWFGFPDLVAMRASVVLLFAFSAALLYRLLRQSLAMVAALGGVVLFAGIPAVWAHAHLGATEVMQCFFWILLALALPSAMKGGRQAALIWVLVCVAAFAAKFTNLLAIGWVLGTAGILGGWRVRRFWGLAVLGLLGGALGLLIVDPFFWPWQGGWSRYLDYLRQVVSRGQWIPIAVFYWGSNWGFRPPWHYRIVETLTTLPWPTLILFLPGLGIGFISLWRQFRNQVVADWPLALGVTGLGVTFLVGLLPGTPNHDITRQFVFVYLAVAILGAVAIDRALSWTVRRPREPGETRFRVAGRGWFRAVRVAALLAPFIAFSAALRSEPFGLGYRGALLGGAGGAWEKGFETSYWGEAITPQLLAAVAGLRSPDGAPPVIFSVPKLNYFSDAGDLWRPLVGKEIATRERLARDAVPAFHDPWVTPEMKARHGEFLRLTFRAPIDGILFFYRRGTVAASYDDVLRRLEAEGDLRLVAETLLGGVSVARLYSVERMTPGQLEGDPEQRVWYQPTWLSEAFR